MNVRMERAINSENLDARITENGALDQKIWAFEVLGVKWSFQEVLRGISIIFQSGWRVLAQKTEHYVEFGKFPGILVEFWRA
jgi:hypothetical protein